MKTYDITALAGSHVAGKRIAEDQKTIKLTDAEAAYELQLGTISLPKAAEVAAAEPEEQAESEPSGKSRKKA